MSLPTIYVEVMFDATDPFDTSGTWTDLADHLDTLAVVRGRQTEDDTAQTGTATAVLIDDDRRFDPNHASGPYYGDLIPMLPLRVRAILDSAEYDYFYGWLDVQNAWIRQQIDPGHSQVNLPANDGFEILSNSYFPVAGTAYSSELTGARISEVFTSGILGGTYPVWSSSGWDLGTSALASSTILAQSIEAIMDGYETMQAYTYSSPTAVLQAVRDAEMTEPGFFFFSGAGYPVFHDRRYRLGVSTSVATFVDGSNLDVAGAVPYTSLTTRRTNLFNDIIVNRNGGTTQEAADAASVTRNLNRQKSLSTMHTTDANALAAAEFYLSLRSTSYEIIESLTLTPGDDSDIWQQVLGREIGDRITIVRTPEDVSGPITEDYFIEAINFSWGPGPDAAVTWRLSSSAEQFNYWLAGVAGSSEAGTTTRAGY